MVGGTGSVPPGAAGRPGSGEPAGRFGAPSGTRDPSPGRGAVRPATTSRRGGRTRAVRIRGREATIGLPWGATSFARESPAGFSVPVTSPGARPSASAPGMGRSDTSTIPTERGRELRRALRSRMPPSACSMADTKRQRLIILRSILHHPCCARSDACLHSNIDSPQGQKFQAGIPREGIRSGHRASRLQCPALSSLFSHRPADRTT